MRLDAFRRLTKDLPGDTPIVTFIGDHTWSRNGSCIVQQLVDEEHGQYGEYGQPPHGELVTVIAIT